MTIDPAIVAGGERAKAVHPDLLAVLTAPDTAAVGRKARRGEVKYSPDQERDDHGRFGSGGAGTATLTVDPATLAETIARGGNVAVPATKLGDVLHAWAQAPQPVNMAHLHVTGIGASHLFTEHAKDLPREAMPVVPANPNGLTEFSRTLAQAGVTARFEQVDPRALMATQNELDGRKVGGMLGALENNGGHFPDSPVIPALVVSKDGEVLDGHHRWAACAAYAVGHPGYRVPVLRCDTSIDRLLDIGWRFDAAQGIAANKFGAKVRFGDVPDSPPPDRDRPWLWFDGRWILISTDTDAGVPRKLDFPAGSTEAKAFDQDQPRDDDGRFAEFASHPATMWHGTPDARTWATGAAYGIHVGSREAAKQALEAKIGKRADGKDWDGTQEYGKTLLASARGGTGYNASGPAEAAYPTGRATYSGGQPIPMDAHPSLFPVRIVGPMTNSRSTPHDDFRANGMMRAQLARGRAKSGYYYTNVGEDEGSVSAVVPSRDHLQTYEDYTAHSTKAKGGPHHSASQYRLPGGAFGKEPKPPKAPFKDPAKDPDDPRPDGAPQIRGGVRVTHTAFVAQHPETAAWVRQGDTIHRFPDADGHVEVSHLDSTWTEFRPKPDGKLHVTRRYEPPPPDPEEGATVSAAIKPKVKVYWNPDDSEADGGMESPEVKGETDAPYYVRELAKPDKDGNRFVVVNHAGVVKASFTSHPAALAYQRALMVNVSGAAAAADRAHGRTPKAVARRGSNPSKKGLPWVEVKYADDQPRDDHGRFGSGGTGTAVADRADHEGVGHRIGALLDRVIHREHGAPHPGVAGTIDRHDTGVDHDRPLVGAGAAMQIAGTHTGGPSGVMLTGREMEGGEGVGEGVVATRTVYAADRDGPAKPDGYESAAKYGMRLDGGPMTDPMTWMLKGDQADKKIWSQVEPTMIDPKGLIATEPFVKTSSIDKVVSGREPLREGYDPKILINRYGQRVVIDGHHRVAMHNALGHGQMRAKVVDLRGVPRKQWDDIEAKAAVAAAMWVRHVDTKGWTWLEVKGDVEGHDFHGNQWTGGGGGGAIHPDVVARAHSENQAKALAMSKEVQDENGGKAAATPENHALAESVLSHARQAEPSITRDLQDFVRSPRRVDDQGNVIGDANAVPRLDGLEYRLKSADSLGRKFTSDEDLKDLTPGQKSAAVGDAVRYTALFDHDRYAEQAQALFDRLKANGYQQGKIKNTWDPANGYRGLNSQWRAPGGQKFELQVHTPTSLVVKNDNHGIYDGRRLLEKDSDDERARYMDAQMRANSARLGESPPGVEKITNCGGDGEPACG